MSDKEILGGKLIHRDDLPMEMAEEIVEKLQELAPGYKFQFAGDHPLSAELEKCIESLEQRIMDSFIAGECFDCGAKVPIPWELDKWAELHETDDEMALPEGWALYSTGDDSCPHLVCPACDSPGGPKMVLMSQTWSRT